MEQKKRQTAYKVRISQLLVGKYVKTTEEWEPNYIQIEDKKISRVNLICYVVDKYMKDDHSYLALVVDDGSGKIDIKTWKEDVSLLEYFGIGDLLLIIGKVKDFNNNIYLVPEIVRKLDNGLWAKLRNLELKKIYGETQEISRASSTQAMKEDRVKIIEEKVTDEEAPFNKSQRILDMIEKFDTNNGADQQLVITQSGVLVEEAQKLITTLIKEGEIFEIRPGQLRTTT